MTPAILITVLVIGLLLRYQHRVLPAGRHTLARLRALVLPVPKRYQDILQRHFPYYRNLKDADKRRFERKVCSFLYSKRFIPRGMKEVSLEARVLIAASAVQLTFGLPDIYLQHFDKILVYPDAYYSSITRRYHKGEVNPRFGIIALALNHFLHDYSQTGSSRNLGLHEMAHALRLENLIRNREYRFFDDKLLRRLDEFAGRVCSNPALYGHFFREYACTNVHEFFSVAVENFFGRSALFKKRIPELYTILTRLLGQDPLQLQQA